MGVIVHPGQGRLGNSRWHSSRKRSPALSVGERCTPARENGTLRELVVADPALGVAPSGPRRSPSLGSRPSHPPGGLADGPCAMPRTTRVEGGCQRTRPAGQGSTRTKLGASSGPLVRVVSWPKSRRRLRGTVAYGKAQDCSLSISRWVKWEVILMSRRSQRSDPLQSSPFADDRFTSTADGPCSRASGVRALKYIFIAVMLS
jgi:hypothetical protein